MKLLLLSLSLSVLPVPWTAGEGSKGCHEVGPQDRLSALLGKLKSKDVRARRKAASELGKTRSPARGVVSALAAALEDEDRTVRRYAARSLGQIGPASRAAVPALVKAREDKRVCPCTIHGVLKRIRRTVRLEEPGGGSPSKPETLVHPVIPPRLQ